MTQKDGMKCVRRGRVVQNCEHITFKTKDCKRTYTCSLINFWQKVDSGRWKNEQREILKMRKCAELIK